MTVWNSNKFASMTEVMDLWQRIPHSSKTWLCSCNCWSKGLTVSTINMLHTVMTIKQRRNDHTRVLAQVAIIVASLCSSRKVRSFLKKRVRRKSFQVEARAPHWFRWVGLPEPSHWLGVQQSRKKSPEGQEQQSNLSEFCDRPLRREEETRRYRFQGKGWRWLRR